MNFKTSNALAVFSGLILVLAFFSLDTSTNGLQIKFSGILNASSRGELNFWLGQVLLLSPGMLLIGWGSGVLYLPALRRMAARLQTLSKAEQYMGLATLTLLAFVVARITRGFFLLDMPMSDDELAVEFGGRILASGQIFAHLPLPPRTVPTLFLLTGERGYTSFDWPGGLVISAVATLTSMGAMLWAVVAAVPVAAIAVAIYIRLGAVWALVGALIFLFSPMAGLMSMTTHAQLASRMFFSLALMAFSFAEKYDRPKHWLVMGIFIGLSFFCRPPEVAFLAAPIGLWLAYRAIQGQPGSRLALAAVCMGAMPGLALLMVHSWAVTGNPLMPARFASGQIDALGNSLWFRFANNFSYNLLMLLVWFLGPLGLALTVVGAAANRFAGAMLAIVCSALVLSLFHDNSGLHIVGPIHYAECVVPLTLAAVFGARQLVSVCPTHLLARIVGAMALIICVGLPIFTTHQALALRQQALVQKVILSAIEKAVLPTRSERAVVLAPNFKVIVDAYPGLAAIGTWVYDWPRPQLDLSDRILYLRYVPEDIPKMQQLMPDRKFYRLRAYIDSPYVTVTPLDHGEPFPLLDLSMP